MAKKQDEKAAKKETKVSASKPQKNTASKSIEEVVESSTEEVVESSAEAVVESSTEEVVGSSAEAVVEPSTEEVVDSSEKEVVESTEEFNWDSITKNEIYSDKERSDLISTYSATLPVVESKQVIDGTVVGISDREVIVDINFKSDGVISSSEFKYNEDLKLGDTVEVLVEKQEDKNGQLVISHRRARVLRAWEKVNVALETGEVVNGQIKSRTKGGMIVDVFGI